MGRKTLEQRRLGEQAEKKAKIKRNLTLGIPLVVAGAVIAVLSLKDAQEHDNTKNHSSTVSAQKFSLQFSALADSVLLESDKQVIQGAAQRYVEKYGSIRPVTIDVQDLDRETRTLPDGSRVIILEQAKPGMITLSSTNGDGYTNIIRHAMTHANQRDDFTPERESTIF